MKFILSWVIDELYYLVLFIDILFFIVTSSS